jgi:hypothetical protein
VRQSGCGFVCSYPYCCRASDGCMQRGCITTRMLHGRAALVAVPRRHNAKALQRRDDASPQVPRRNPHRARQGVAANCSRRDWHSLKRASHGVGKVAVCATRGCEQALPAQPRAAVSRQPNMRRRSAIRALPAGRRADDAPPGPARISDRPATRYYRTVAAGQQAARRISSERSHRLRQPVVCRRKSPSVNDLLFCPMKCGVALGAKKAGQPSESAAGSDHPRNLDQPTRVSARVR